MSSFHIIGPYMCQVTRPARNSTQNGGLFSAFVEMIALKPYNYLDIIAGDREEKNG